MTDRNTRFAGKVAIVTGAASGIGAATARMFHRDAAKVVIADVDEAAGSALAGELGDRAIFTRTDVGDAASVEQLVASTLSAFGRLDILVNNAAVFAGMGMETPDLPPDLWDRMIRITQTGTFYGCRAAIPAMKRTGGGAIVNVASVSGMGGDAGMSAYSAAKGAIVNYTRTLALDHGKDGIRVNAVCPGPVVTSRSMITQPDVEDIFLPRVALGRYGRPDEIAAPILFLASDEAALISGAIIPVDGGITASSGQPNLVPFMRKSRAHQSSGGDA